MYILNQHIPFGRIHRWLPRFGRTAAPSLLLLWTDDGCSGGGGPFCRYLSLHMPRKHRCVRPQPVGSSHGPCRPPRGYKNQRRGHAGRPTAFFNRSFSLCASPSGMSSTKCGVAGKFFDAVLPRSSSEYLVPLNQSGNSFSSCVTLPFTITTATAVPVFRPCHHHQGLASWTTTQQQQPQPQPQPQPPQPPPQQPWGGFPHRKRHRAHQARVGRDAISAHVRSGSSRDRLGGQAEADRRLRRGTGRPAPATCPAPCTWPR
jgi:hypothetical protein